MKNKTASQNGRRNRQKGQEFEREVVHMFNDAGISAERIKGSGQQASGHNDIVLTHFGADGPEIECKRKSKGWSSLYKLINQDGVDIVALRADNEPALAVVKMSMLIDLINHDGL